MQKKRGTIPFALTAMIGILAGAFVCLPFTSNTNTAYANGTLARATNQVILNEVKSTFPPGVSSHILLSDIRRLSNAEVQSLRLGNLPSALASKVPPRALKTFVGNKLGVPVTTLPITDIRSLAGGNISRQSQTFLEGKLGIPLGGANIMDIRNISAGSIPTNLISNVPPAQLRSFVGNQLGVPVGTLPITDIRALAGGNISRQSQTFLEGQLGIPLGGAGIGDIKSIASGTIPTNLIDNVSPTQLKNFVQGHFPNIPLGGSGVSLAAFQDLAQGIVPPSVETILGNQLGISLDAVSLKDVTALAKGQFPSSLIGTIPKGNLVASLQNQLGVDLSGVNLGTLQNIAAGKIPQNLTNIIPTANLTNFLGTQFGVSLDGMSVGSIKNIASQITNGQIPPVFKGLLADQFPDFPVDALGLDLGETMNLLKGDISPDLAVKLLNNFSVIDKLPTDQAFAFVSGLLPDSFSGILDQLPLGALSNLSPAAFASLLDGDIPLELVNKITDFIPNGAIAALLGNLGLADLIAKFGVGNLDDLVDLLGGAILEGIFSKTALEDPAHVDKLNRLLRENWIASFMMMTEQMTTVMMQQVMTIGSFLDAKHQLETLQIFQEMTAQAHKDYQPSTQMCVFGTNMRSLAASEAKARANARIMNMTMMRRETISANVLSSEGQNSDLLSRLEQFKTTYCDPNDNNGSLRSMCKGYKAPARPGGLAKRPNNDINFTRTLDSRYTLDVDFTDNVLTADEEDIIALSRNLFSHKTFSRVGEHYLLQEFAKDDYMEMRSVLALRSVADNSFGHLVGMKTAGSDTKKTVPFAKNIMLQLGVPKEEIGAFLGENPSYFAQMEVLTRKMYQNPVFFTNLYTKPANVKRTGVAIQALKLMNDRDRYEAALRREMLISSILEIRLRERQKNVNNNLLHMMSTLFVDPLQ